MAFERARNIIDGAFVITFALSATTGTAGASAAMDLAGNNSAADTWQNEKLEVELLVPAITTAQAVQGADIVYQVESSSTSTFGTIDEVVFSKKLTAVTAVIPAQTLRGRLPSNCSRYLRGSVNINVIGTTGGATAATSVATLQLRF